MDQIRDFDISLFLTLHRHHTPFSDDFMWYVSGMVTWLPVLLVLLYIIFRKGWKTGLLFIVSLAVVITISDQISSSLIKPLVGRLRPTHDPSLSPYVLLVHGYRGGLYSFVSSHAANSVGIAAFIAMVLRNRLASWALAVWVMLICYSRIYIGVHFPADLLCGSMIGLVAAFAGWKLFCYLCKRFLGQIPAYAPADSHLLISALAANVIIFAIVALF